MKNRIDYSEYSIEALTDKEGELRKSLFTLRMDLAINKLKNHRNIRNTRRELAKVLTFINQRKRAAEKVGKEG
jgi:ribosomal protein L29